MTPSANPDRSDPSSVPVARVVFLRRNIEDALSYRVDSRALDPDRDAPDLIGSPVVVPLGSELTVGLVIDAGPDSEHDPSDLKPIRDVITSLEPIPRDLIRLGKWVSRYYMAPLPRVFRAILPPRYLPDPVLGWECGDLEPPEQMDPALRDSLSEQDSVDAPDLLEATGWTRTRLMKTMREWSEELAINETLRLERAEVSRRRLNYLLPGETTDSPDLEGRRRDLLQHVLEREGCFQKDLPGVLKRTELIRDLEERGLIEREKRVFRRLPLPEVHGEPATPDFELTEEQSRVVEAVGEDLREGHYETHLIHGVTGSGKTEVYFRLAERVLERGGSVLVLVPEITLAAFMVSRFRERFGDELALLHSELSQGERLDEWRRIQSGDARVVLGVQSAVFAPLVDPGLIVVDEEHDTSYKSGQTPRYHARDVAVMRATMNEIPVLLGSATPSLESYANSVRGRYRKHDMLERPRAGSLPEVRITDLRGEDSLMTQSLVETTREVLERGHRALWFLNRRGFSNFVLCDECGFVKNCNQCSVSLTLHGKESRLRCHYCGYTDRVPDRCPECGETSLVTVGSGTEKLTRRAEELYGEKRVLRMDSDTVGGKGARYEKLKTFGETRGVLLIGTQMVTKGLDFEDVDFVGVVHADTGLQFPDFRSGERTFQQLVQVCGRAGRKKTGASVQVQTYNPGHYAILYGQQQDYEAFFRVEMKNRKPLNYPPFSRLINVIASGEDEATVSRSLNRLRERIPPVDGVDLLGPSPCGIDYLKGKSRWHLMARGRFSASWRRTFREELRGLNTPVNLTVDVDPVDVL